MNTVFETTFYVFPEHTNHNAPMIFGGAFFSQLDLTAALAVKRFLYDSLTCDDAVTYKFEEGVFHKPCYVGDLLFLVAEIISAGRKSLVVKVRAFREKKQLHLPVPDKELVASAKFIFVTLARGKVKNDNGTLPYAEHGLTV